MSLMPTEPQVLRGNLYSSVVANYARERLVMTLRRQKGMQTKTLQMDLLHGNESRVAKSTSASHLVCFKLHGARVLERVE